MMNFLFPQPTASKGYSLLLLALRVIFGLLLMSHGFDKIFHYAELYSVFPDPVGLGSTLSLIFAIFGELFCSIAFIFGVLYRIFMIPMIIVMGTAFFHIHQGDIAQGELAFLYFMVFIIMYISGPGKYSIDSLIYMYLQKKKYN